MSMSGFGDFYCEACGWIVPEREIESVKICPECGHYFFVRKPAALFRGSGDGWCGHLGRKKRSIKRG